ncbi:MAG: hypothetical protein ABL867_01425 [Rickettsiales bacterium]
MTTKKKLATAALAGLFTAGMLAAPAFAADKDNSKMEKASCSGKDGCAGKDAKGAKDKHACKGHNECKGQGADGKNECKGKGSCATDDSKKEAK